MKKTVLSSLVSAVVLSGAAYAADVGVVDIQSVFDKTPQGHATLMKLQSDVQPKVDALKAEQQKLQDDAQAFQKNAPTMSDTERKKQQDSLMADQKAFQAKVEALTDAEHGKEKDAAKTFTDDLKSAVSKVASKKHLDVILTAEAAPYYSPKSDVTMDVVSAMKSK